MPLITSGEDTVPSLPPSIVPAVAPTLMYPGGFVLATWYVPGSKLGKS